MRTMLQRLGLLCVLPLLAATAFAQGIVAERNPLIYAVTSKTATVYLFGTIHIGSRVLYPLPQPIDEAFTRSTVLALEIDPTEQMQLRAALARTFYPPPDRLQSHIPGHVFVRAQQIARRYQIPVEVVQQMKPYTLSMALAFAEMEKLGYDGKLGLDLHLATRAHQDGKRVVQLESMLEQVEVLDRLSAGVHVAMLSATMDGIRSGELANQTNEMFDAWQTGNGEWMLELSERDSERLPAAMADKYRESFYTRRNRQMAKKVQSLLNGRETCFVAVGALHLLGPTGLVELLNKRGYAVQRVAALER